MITEDRILTLVGVTLIGGLLIFVIWADYRLNNIVDSCAPGLVLQTPKGWVCTEVITR